LCCAALSIAADWLFLDVSLPYHGLPLMCHIINNNT